ncbi:crossover junction endodeoxyribonuclease RuvC [bacterium]|nr:crossover junction endodeoxyribonuclease RuvC [bacterium]MBU1072841.1 crossover junction endodeoxyribonuclease RuvC [bacterium]MBU1675016.1 crossover junction endodeoxyribonuclease RuvC [bacterium]
MIILGIDPGSRRTGYGVIECRGNRFRYCDAGTIATTPGAGLPLRLRIIHESLVAIIADHAPDVAAIEDVFNARNARSSLILGQARGAAMLAAALRDITVAEYAPREVKMALTGNGAATKEQVRFMVQRLLGLARPPSSTDASDALGVALCYAMRSGSPAMPGNRKGHER